MQKFGFSQKNKFLDNFYALLKCIFLIYENLSCQFCWAPVYLKQFLGKEEIKGYPNMNKKCVRNVEYVWMSRKVTSKYDMPGIPLTRNASTWSSRRGQVIWMTVLDSCGLLWPMELSWPLHQNHSEVLKMSNTWNGFEMLCHLCHLCHISFIALSEYNGALAISFGRYGHPKFAHLHWLTDPRLGAGSGPGLEEWNL